MHWLYIGTSFVDEVYDSRIVDSLFFLRKSLESTMGRTSRVSFSTSVLQQSGRQSSHNSKSKPPIQPPTPVNYSQLLVEINGIALPFSLLWNYCHETISHVPAVTQHGLKLNNPVEKQVKFKIRAADSFHWKGCLCWLDP